MWNWENVTYSCRDLKYWSASFWLLKTRKLTWGYFALSSSILSVFSLSKLQMYFKISQVTILNPPKARLWLNNLLKSLQTQRNLEKWKYIKVSARANLISKVEKEHPSTTHESSSSMAFWIAMNSFLSLFFPSGSNICLSRWCTGMPMRLPSLAAKVDFPLPGNPIRAKRLGACFFIELLKRIEKTRLY